MDLGLTGKHVLITGGSKGIGLACALAFAREGARVTIVSRAADNIVAAQGALRDAGFDAQGYAANLSEFDDAERVVTLIEQEVGPIDVLINSAGAAKRYDPDALDGAALRAGMEAKYFPNANTQELVLRSMRRRGHGAIVNIIGNGGKVGTAVHVTGGAANAALMLSTVALAKHYARAGIRINAINPGLTMTSRLDEGFAVDARRAGISKEETIQRATAGVPLGRFARAEEVADVALFLASERASYVVGAIVPMEGGGNAAI